MSETQEADNPASAGIEPDGLDDAINPPDLDAILRPAAAREQIDVDHPATHFLGDNAQGGLERDDAPELALPERLVLRPLVIGR